MKLLYDSIFTFIVVVVKLIYKCLTYLSVCLSIDQAAAATAVKRSKNNVQKVQCKGALK